MTTASMTVTDTHDAIKSRWRRSCNLKTKILITAIAILVFLAILCAYLIVSGNYFLKSTEEPPDPVEPQKPSASPLRVFEKCAVCTEAPPCSEIGKNILAKNGSAVDAAIGAMFCNGLFNQQSLGLGGGFFMVVYIKEEGKAYSVNARERAPGAATVEMFHEDHNKSRSGVLSVGVPGELRGMWKAYKRWGKLPWESLVTPTVELCKAGFPLSRINYDGFSSSPTIKDDPYFRRMYYDSAKEEYYKPGTLIKPPEEMCNTFQRIAEKGGDELYNGSLAIDFLDDLQSIGGIITAEDLKLYEAEIAEPIAVTFDNGDILYTSPPPSSGIVLINILNILRGYNFNESSISTTEDKILTYHRIIEAFKYAYVQRSKLGDPHFLDLKELVNKLLSKEFGTEVRMRINDTMTSNSSATYGAEFYNQPDSGTGHTSIIAPNGDCVAVTSSINYYFGAGFMTKKTGLAMNNVMDDFSSPGIINNFGLKPTEANFIEPYKRPMSSMNPSIIVDNNGDAKLVVGASGGPKITTAVALVIMRKLWFNQSIKEAVDAARFHHQIAPMVIDYQLGIPQDIVRGLRAKGHGMQRYLGRGSTSCVLYRNRTAIFGTPDYRKVGDIAGV